jgi:murein DD-endopeptidase MepM/ murein hydrolase activator NlpD
MVATLATAAVLGLGCGKIENGPIGRVVRDSASGAVMAPASEQLSGITADSTGNVAASPTHAAAPATSARLDDTARAHRTDSALRTLRAMGADAAANAGAPEPTGATPSAADLATLKGELAMPLDGVAPSSLQDTYHESRGDHIHEALDILAPRGTPVRSAAAGRVLKLLDSKAGGLMVYAADASERFILMYGHLDRWADGLRDGAPLRQGQIIGYVGTTGNAPATTPHLHMAVAYTSDVSRWWKGTPVDVRPLLQR